MKLLPNMKGLDRFAKGLLIFLCATMLFGLGLGILIALPFVLGRVLAHYAKKGTLRALVWLQANKKLIQHRAFVLFVLPTVVPVTGLLVGAVEAFLGIKAHLVYEWRGAKRYWRGEYA